MKALSTSLIAAQQSSSAVPAVKVTASDTILGAARLHFTRIYTGSEPDYFHAATMPSDGSLIRSRISPPSDSRRLFYQRVTTPGEGADFSQWVNSGQYNCVVTAAAALGTEISIFWIRSDRRIQRIRSTDCGATWGATELIDYSISSAINGIGAAYKPNGDLAIFFADQQTLYVKKYTSGAWQTQTAWDKTTGDLSGASVVYDGGWCLFVTGKDTAGNFKLWSLSLSDAGVWSTLNEIASAPAASGYEFRHASLAKPDVFRCFYVEKYSGEQSYSRPYSTQTVTGSAFSDGLWRESTPFNLSSDYGLDNVHHGDYCWLSSPAGVWLSSFQTETLDLSADIVFLKQDINASSGHLSIELRNDDQRYANPTAPLLPGGEIFFEPGYITSQGSETSAGQSFQITAREHRSSGGKSSFVLYAEDGWSGLESWRARQMFRWNQGANQKSVKDILAFILARAGLKLEVVSQSETATTYYPDFSINPADDGKSVVIKLLAFLTDVIFIEGNKAFLVNPQTSDAVCYSYGTSHAILEGRYRQGELVSNSLRVEGYNPAGGPILVDVFDWDAIGSQSERIASVEDRNLGSTTQAEQRGTAILNKSRIKSASGLIRVIPNCGQQLFDVIELSDGRTGLVNIHRRVLGLNLTYLPLKGTYSQEIVLGGV